MSRPFHNHKRRGHRNNSFVRPSHGFSRFSDSTAVFAYDYSMDSTDIASNNDGGSNATLVEGPFTAFELFMFRNDYDLPGGKLNRAERRYIRRQAGCIVHQSSDGFISVTWVKTAKELDKKWESVQQYYYGDESPESEESN